MRVLVLGDIHGNLVALEDVIAFEQGSYDMIICHGDVVNYGPWSNECIDFLLSLENVIYLRGNHEEYFLKGKYDGTHPVAKEFFKFCIKNFKREDQIKSLQNKFLIGDYIIQHTILDSYIFPDTIVNSIDNNFIIGHSHYQFNRKIGLHSLINTGSVGQNRKYINQSDYVIYDIESKIIELKSLLFNIDHVIGQMVYEKYPEICLNYYLNKERR